MTDREIIEWIANAQVGDAVPFSSDEMLRVLRGIGYPIPNGSPAFNGPEVSAWARVWLAEHPAGVRR